MTARNLERTVQDAGVSRRIWCFALAALAPAMMLADRAAQAQAFPNRPLTVIVPLAAGTGVDIIARMYGEKLAQALGKPVVIENKPGAATMLGVGQTATAQPDGHTLGVATATAMVINPTLYKKVSYDTHKDFIPISLYLKSPFVLSVNPNLPVRTVPELIKYAKETSTPLTFSSPGAGTVQHLTIEFLKKHYGVNMTHVPYRSNPQSIADVVAGHIHMSMVESGQARPLMREGKLRGIAVSSATRLGVLPDVPTLAEAIDMPNFEAVSWHILLVPAATPKEIADRLYNEMKMAMAEPDIVKRMTDMGQMPVASPPIEGMRAYMKAEQEKWGSLVRSLGLEGSQ